MWIIKRKLGFYCSQRKSIAEGRAKYEQKFQIITNRSNCFFRETKLIKNVEAKKQLRLNISVSSAKSLTPSFGNTLLYAVPFVRLVFSLLV